MSLPIRASDRRSALRRPGTGSDGYGLGTIPNLEKATRETLVLVVDGKA